MAREATALGEVERDSRQGDRRLDLRAVAHDAGVAHQGFDLGGAVANDRLRREAVKGGAKARALAQDREPGKPRLEAVEDELLEDRPIVPFGHAPFLIVIGDIERVEARPRTAADAVGVGERMDLARGLRFLGHGAS